MHARIAAKMTKREQPKTSTTKAPIGISIPLPPSKLWDDESGDVAVGGRSVWVGTEEKPVWGTSIEVGTGEKSV